MKKMISWIIASAVIMLVFPWLAVTFVKGDGGMAVCFILFFALNPIYAIFAGVQASRDVKRFWALPMITAVLFLAGTWLHFDMGEPAFLLYALIYSRAREETMPSLQPLSASVAMTSSKPGNTLMVLLKLAATWHQRSNVACE